MIEKRRKRRKWRTRDDLLMPASWLPMCFRNAEHHPATTVFFFFPFFPFFFLLFGRAPPQLKHTHQMMRDSRLHRINTIRPGRVREKGRGKKRLFPLRSTQWAVNIKSLLPQLFNLLLCELLITCNKVQALTWICSWAGWVGARGTITTTTTTVFFKNVFLLLFSCTRGLLIVG